MSSLKMGLASVYMAMARPMPYTRWPSFVVRLRLENNKMSFQAQTNSEIGNTY